VVPHGSDRTVTNPLFVKWIFYDEKDKDLRSLLHKAPINQPQNQETSRRNRQKGFVRRAAHAAVPAQGMRRAPRAGPCWETRIAILERLRSPASAAGFSPCCNRRTASPLPLAKATSSSRLKYWLHSWQTHFSVKLFWNRPNAWGMTCSLDENRLSSV
jgi:hypothetical protein